MLCHHCGASFDRANELGENRLSIRDGVATWVRFWRCPSCLQLMLALERTGHGPGPVDDRLLLSETIVYPATGARLPAPAEVREYDAPLANDYDEACSVLERSPKSAAALGRRCIQRMIRTQLGIKKPTLAQEIEQARTTDALPVKVLRQLDATRHIGNNAAHPNTDQAGFILEVTYDEAVWTLDVVLLMFDELYVQPEREHARTKALAEKTGKEMKLPDLPKMAPATPEDVDLDEVDTAESAG